MFKGSVSILINRPVEFVYSIAETYPYFVSFFKKNSRIISQDEKQLTVEVHSCLFKLFPASWQGQGVKEKNKAIHFRQTKGLFKNLTADWIFENIDGKTKVSILSAFSKPWLTNLGEKWIARAVVEKVTKNILQELKKRSELIDKG